MPEAISSFADYAAATGGHSFGLDQCSRRAAPLRYVGVPPPTSRAKLGRLCEGVGNLSAWPTRDRGGTIYCGLAVIPACRRRELLQRP
jgi:hypothetical protein